MHVIVSDQSKHFVNLVASGANDEELDYAARSLCAALKREHDLNATGEAAVLSYLLELRALTTAELVADPDFNDPSKWQSNPTSNCWVVSGGVATHANGGVAGYIQDIESLSLPTVEVSYDYEVVMDVASGVKYAQLYIGNNPAIAAFTSPGTYTGTATGKATNTLGFALRCGAFSADCVVSRFSMKLAAV